MLSTSIEDYIKTIYGLEVEHRKATTKRIATSLDVKMASVTGMVKHLAAEGFLRHIPYQGVHLTEKGRKVAVKMIRRHRIIELFLCRTLSLTWDEVDADEVPCPVCGCELETLRESGLLGCPASWPLLPAALSALCCGGSREEAP